MIVIQFTIIYYCVFEADLVCPNSGSEIVIDGIGMESQKFRFPAVGTFGFPEQVYLQPIILIVLISFFLFEAIHCFALYSAQIVLFLSCFRDFECKWIFKAQPGLRLLLQSRDATIDENERIQVLDTNGEFAFDIDLEFKNCF